MMDEQKRKAFHAIAAAEGNPILRMRMGDLQEILDDINTFNPNDPCEHCKAARAAQDPSEIVYIERPELAGLMDELERLLKGGAYHGQDHPEAPLLGD